jgi:uncharacterized LabA/DUF88 family protein
MFAQRYYDKEFIIVYDVLRDKIVDLTYFYNYEEFGYGIQNDSVLYKSISTYDINYDLIKVINFYNYLFVDSIVRTKINDSTYTPLRLTKDKMDYSNINNITKYNENKQVTERKLFKSKKILFFTKRKLVFWHKYFYLRNYVP